MSAESLREIIAENWSAVRREVEREYEGAIRRVGGLTRAFLRIIPERARRLYYGVPRAERARVIRDVARTGRMFGMFMPEDAVVLARRIVRERRRATYLRRFLASPVPPSVSQFLVRLGEWAEGFERRGFDMLAYVARNIRSRKIEELWIGDEACSGMDIIYGGDVYLIVDPETGEIVRSEREIYVEVTATVATGGGHEPIAVEIHGVSAVPPAPPERVSHVERGIEVAMFSVAQDRWGPALARTWERTSVLYNGSSHAERAGLYPVAVPEYPRILYCEERRGKYPPYRRYPSEGYYVIGAEGEYLGEVA